MSNETRKTFEIVCSMNHFVRSTQYGEVFRTTTSVGGVEKIRDVLRVSIPFNPKREALLRDKMGDDTNDFYKKFARCVSNDIKIRRYIGTLDASGDDRTAVENLKASNLTISANHQLKHEGVPGSDIYLISDVAEPFVGSNFFSGYAFTMTNLAMFAARAAQIIKGLDTYHVHLGAIDLDSIVLRTKDDGKQLFAFSSFLYGGFDEGYEPKDKAGQPWRVNSFPATVPVTMDENIRNGEERPSLVGDMHSLAALLWVILCGDDYRNAPNWDLTPQYAPDRTAQLLKEVYASDDPEMLKALQKEFRGIARNIGRGDLSESVIRLELSRPLLSERDMITPPEPLKKESESGESTGATQKHEEKAKNSEEPEEEVVEVVEIIEDEPAETPSAQQEHPPAEPAPVGNAENAAEKPQEAEETAPPVAEPVDTPVVSVSKEPEQTSQEVEEVPAEDPCTEEPEEPAAEQGSAEPERKQSDTREAVEPAKPPVVIPQVNTVKETEQPAPKAEPVRNPAQKDSSEQDREPSHKAEQSKEAPAETAPPAPQQPVQAAQHEATLQAETEPAQTVPPYQQQFVQQPAPPFGYQPVFAQPVYQPVYPVYPPQPYSPPQPQPQTPPQPEPKPASQPQAAPQAPTQDDVPNKPPTVVRRTVTTYRPKKRPFAAFLRFIIIFALLAFGVLCGLKYAGVPVPIDIPYITAGDTFTVSPREVTLSIGGEAAIQSSAACTLSSSNHAVATISDNGTIHAVGAGTCTITAKATEGNGTARVNVIVTN